MISLVKKTLNKYRLEPDTFISGFQKCGTTSLYNYLVETGVYIPGHVKENDKLISGGDYLTKYLFRFPWKWKGEKTLCASHMIGFNPLGIERLKKHFPRGKYIFIMRNPVKRAFSRYQHNQRKEGNIDKKFRMTFEELVDFELDLLSQIDIENVEEIYNVTSQINPYGLPISRGLYKPFLKKFKDYGLNIHELHLEDLQKDYESEMRNLFDFLETDSSIPPQEVYNKAPYTHKMDLATEEKLVTFFSEKGYELKQ